MRRCEKEITNRRQIDAIMAKTKSCRIALDILMKKYAGRTGFSYTDDELDKIIIIDVKIEQLSGKQSG